MLDKVDITIVGAGVIGLSVAAQLADYQRQVYVLERNERFGLETSSRNSEVIHSGIYYPPGSLKAMTCVKGNALIYELCNKYRIGCKQLGKLIVATNNRETEELETLLDRGRENGVKGLKMLTRGEIKSVEPNIEALAGILSPFTGIIDSYGLMRYFLGTAQEKGANVVYKSEVVGIEKASDGYKVTVADNSGFSSFKTAVVINCAGLSCDRVAALAGVDTIRAGYKLHYCKGEYFSVGRGKGDLVKRLVYPVPERKGVGVGIHAILNLEGRMRLGPTVRYLERIDYAIDEAQRVPVAHSVRKFLPFIEPEDLAPEVAGIRPTLQGPGDEFRDFVITKESRRGLPGLINLVGIESPGLTSAPAIAQLVSGMVREIL